MPLDWLFGKKKPEPDPLQYSSTVLKPTEDRTNTSGDDFVFLENNVALSNDGERSMYPRLPYDIAPAHQDNPVNLEQSSVQLEVVSASSGWLNDVPFKLTCTETFDGIDSALAHNMRTSQMVKYLRETMNSELLSYDFQVEKSVLHEAGCRDFG